MADRREGRQDSPQSTPLKVSVKMLAKYLLILPGLAIIVVIALFFAFIGLAP